MDRRLKILSQSRLGLTSPFIFPCFVLDFFGRRIPDGGEAASSPVPAASFALRLPDEDAPRQVALKLQKPLPDDAVEIARRDAKEDPSPHDPAIRVLFGRDLRDCDERLSQ